MSPANDAVREGVKMNFRLRLHARPAAAYLAVDEAKLVRAVHAAITGHLRLLMDDVQSEMEGVVVGLDDLDMQLGDYWTPYQQHDPETPSATGYHIHARTP